MFVRVVDEPANPGRLCLGDNARRNRAVREDVRILTRAQANELRLPAEDFWHFDSRVVALLHFDDTDEMTGVEPIANPCTSCGTASSERRRGTARYRPGGDDRLPAVPRRPRRAAPRTRGSTSAASSRGASAGRSRRCPCRRPPPERHRG
ncbi:DUF6879 family protein [Streptomyces sp. NPDC015130]|uniref:DUF6879 family protein n=1 Tax=Streptomyces sp. NPDC015130 TaxID=3364940 RepID=UPI003702EE14